MPDWTIISLQADGTTTRCVLKEEYNEKEYKWIESVRINRVNRRMFCNIKAGISERSADTRRGFINKWASSCWQEEKEWYLSHEKEIDHKYIMTPEQEAQLRLGCIICRKPAELHHLRCDGGMGLKGQRTIPLCAWHHRVGRTAIHQSKRVFEDSYGTEEQLYARCRDYMIVEGLYEPD